VLSGHSLLVIYACIGEVAFRVKRIGAFNLVVLTALSMASCALFLAMIVNS